jgi:hypothetical protein
MVPFDISCLFLEYLVLLNEKPGETVRSMPPKTFGNIHLFSLLNTWLLLHKPHYCVLGLGRCVGK